MFSTIVLTATSLLFSAAQAHMILNSPVPFDKANLNNSPLENAGTNFPCKFGTVETGGNYGAVVTTMNNMKVGEPQTLSFIGGATHSGGSCQISITTDTAPTKDSQWKVIHTIVSGCPSNATGNLSEDSAGTNAATFSYAIPRGVPSGKYSLAWTWFNKSGNREMYMNCAPITVTGAGSRRKRSDSMPDAWNKLPNMFVANIPNEQCSTTEGEDLNFPPAFQSGAPAETPFKTALGSSMIGSGCSSMNAMGAGKGKAALAVPTPAPAVSAPAAPIFSAASSMVASAPATSMAASAPVPVDDPAPTAAPLPSAPAPAPSMAISSAPAAAPSAAPATGSGSCLAGKVPCTGVLVCIGTNQFALCDRGCGLPQALAAGTTCNGGTISKRQVLPKNGWSGMFR